MPSIEINGVSDTNSVPDAKGASDKDQVDGKTEEDGNAERDFENNNLWKVLSKQIKTLREEMEASRKSAEEGAKDNGGMGFDMPFRCPPKKNEEDDPDK